MQKYKIAKFILFGLLNVSFPGKQEYFVPFRKTRSTPTSPATSPRQTTEFSCTSKSHSLSELYKAIEDNGNPLTKYASMLLYSCLYKNRNQKLQIKPEGLQQMLSNPMWQNSELFSDSESIGFKLKRNGNLAIEASLQCTAKVVTITASTPQASEVNYAGLETIDPLRPVIGACILRTKGELNLGATSVKLSAKIANNPGFDAFISLSYSKESLKITINTFYNTVSVVYDGKLLTIEARTAIDLSIFVKKAVNILDIIIPKHEKEKISQTIGSITSEQWLNMQLLMIGSSLKDHKLPLGVEITSNSSLIFQFPDLNAEMSYILSYCNRWPGVQRTIEEEGLEGKVNVDESTKPLLRTELTEELADTKSPKSPTETDIVSEFDDRVSVAKFSLFTEEVSLTPKDPGKIKRPRSTSVDISTNRYRASAAIIGSRKRADSSPPILRKRADSGPPAILETLLPTIDQTNQAPTPDPVPQPESRRRKSREGFPKFGTGDNEFGAGESEGAGQSDIGSLIGSDAESFSTRHSNAEKDSNPDMHIDEEKTAREPEASLADWMQEEVERPLGSTGLQTPTVTNFLPVTLPLPRSRPQETPTEFAIHSPPTEPTTEPNDIEPESEAATQDAHATQEVDATQEVENTPQQRVVLQPAPPLPQITQTALQAPQTSNSKMSVEFSQYMIIFFSIVFFLCILYILALEARIAENNAQAELRQSLTDLAADLLELST